MSTVLVVDDKEMMRDSVGATLRRAGFGVLTCGDARAALELIAKRRPDAVVTDLKMPGMSGIELLAGIREIDDELPVVLMTAFGTIETAVEAMKRGAFDYITKPFEGDELVIAVKRALQHGRLVKENLLLRSAIEPASGSAPGTGVDRLIGSSEAMRQVREQVERVAATQGTVLITGESGTGKEVVARAVHEASTRNASAFLAVNCAALSESLLESELFGHERGAFTGAESLRKGRFELADRGTLLLDEVSEVSPQIQAKLLRVLQERAFERVGSSVTIGIDVRVLATSNRDLQGFVADGGFREDLFFRLNVLPIEIPPLRERGGDAVELAGHFLARVCEREGREPVQLSAEAARIMTTYRWPGNVRELQNICERAVVLTPRTQSVVSAELIGPWLCARAPRTAPTPASGGYGGLPGGGGNGLPPSFTVNGRLAAGNGVVAEASRLAAQTIEVKPQGGVSLTRPAFAHDPRQGPRPVARPLYPSSAVVEQPEAEPAVVSSAVGLIEPAPVPRSELPGDRTLAEIERETIVATLRRFNGHRQKTAQALGIGVRTLGLKLKKWKDERLVPSTL